MNETVIHVCWTHPRNNFPPDYLASLYDRVGTLNAEPITFTDSATGKTREFATGSVILTGPSLTTTDDDSIAVALRFTNKFMTILHEDGTVQMPYHLSDWAAIRIPANAAVRIDDGADEPVIVDSQAPA